MWGNYSFNFACSLARGRSGGLISIWDPNVFLKESIWCDEAFIIVKGRWKNSGGDCYMINIYGPHDPVAKVSLWNKIREFMQSHMGKYVLFGDMNEVRNEHERHGSIFSRSEADFFNSFINNVGLIELPMGGRLFTWMNKAGTKLSKLDRFLFSEDVIEELPDMRGFNDFISLEWANIGQNVDGIIILSHEKLKRLKVKIKQWIANSKSGERIHKQEIMSALKQLEENIEAGSASPDDREKRIKLIQEADSLETLEAMDTMK
ncbi:RNA-directed DNA polymerase, eukaryota [Artemisia annua]|uniref:RNA-directed DNA polymerase, eukaryota n=1 Tax=Artemisia annua TaxID=35608 RepID=A0A2U1NT01_ARTAN|nr:RNA-directed DNA polymerase, eukaryota [Artemisia annua]